jgi:hypothetical protein
MLLGCLAAWWDFCLRMAATVDRTPSLCLTASGTAFPRRLPPLMMAGVCHFGVVIECRMRIRLRIRKRCSALALSIRHPTHCFALAFGTALLCLLYPRLHALLHQATLPLPLPLLLMPVLLLLLLLAVLHLLWDLRLRVLLFLFLLLLLLLLRCPQHPERRRAVIQGGCCDPGIWPSGCAVMRAYGPLQPRMLEGSRVVSLHT